MPDEGLASVFSSFRLNEAYFSPNKSLRAIDAKSAKALKSEIITQLDAVDAVSMLADLETKSAALEFLAAAFSLSPFLRDQALIHPKEFATLLSGDFETVVTEVTQRARGCWVTSGSDADFMRELRIAKRSVGLALGLADLGGWLATPRIAALLSEFAGAILASASEFLLCKFQGEGAITLVDSDNPSKGSGLIVLGMGKLGAHELNYSSDVDIIIFFDPRAEMLINTDDPTTLFVRFAKQLSRLLQERTGDGYVFRVDLRLRPDPGSTPLAMSVDTAFNYYEAYGQNWERAAYIKARPVAGDLSAGKLFLDELSPFIWRKYLDFAAIADVHSIKRQIHAHRGHGQITVKGHNIKLGRGGIREIEFFVQTQQLIAGGRNTNLRQIGTITGLNALAMDGWITAETADELTQCYWYLRDVEHRIQMVADEQSHTLPDDDAGLKHIALMMGDNAIETFTAKLTKTMRTVEQHYAALFETSPGLSAKGGNLVFTGDDDDPQTVETLVNLGFSQPSQIIASIKGWHFGRLQVVRSAQARELLTELTPSLIEAFSHTDQPDQSFFAFERFLSGLPSGIQLFSILKSNPDLLALLVKILGSSPRLTDIITQRPNVFDGLIDPSLEQGIPDANMMHARLEAMLQRALDYESQLDQIRIFAKETKFLISIRLINRTINANQAGQAFSLLAEILLEHVLKIVRIEFETRHGKIDGGEIAILGMGRLGSAELTAGSDLDLIFLYRHNHDAQVSNGKKALYPAPYFMRLVQRLTSAMSAPTAEGVLYELDFRLRPSGNSGPLATHIDSFVKYQRHTASTWERQALVRARVITGGTHLVEEINIQLGKLLAPRGDRKKISADVLKMRKQIDLQKPPVSVFDLKTARGGIIDIEFIAQWGILISGSKIAYTPDRSTTTLINIIPDRVLSKDEKSTLSQAFVLYNTLLQLLRIHLPDSNQPEQYSRQLSAELALHAGVPDLARLRVLLKNSQKMVRKIFTLLLKN